MGDRFTGKDAVIAAILALFVLCTWLPRLKGPVVRTLFFFREILAKRFGAWSHAPGFAVLFVVFLLEGVVLSQLYRFSHQEVVYSAKNGEPIRFRWFYYDPAQQGAGPGVGLVQG